MGEPNVSNIARIVILTCSHFNQIEILHPAAMNLQ
jgi:hypothetical protein